jgi:hypothetical protein
MQKKEIIKISVKINKIEKKNCKENHETQSWFGKIKLMTL